MASQLAWHIVFAAVISQLGSATDFDYRLKNIGFDSARPAAHHTQVKVGIWFENLYHVNSHTSNFDADMYLTYMWPDDRNYTSLFAESEAGSWKLEGRRALEGDSAEGSCGLRKYVEFGHDELKYLWLPDLSIRNTPSGYTPTILKKFVRLYDDGTFALSLFVRATMLMKDAFYKPFPFDQQELSVVIESESHTDDRLGLVVLEEYSGLELDKTKDWPGWNLVDPADTAWQAWWTDHSISEPAYVHKMACQIERSSRVTFRVHVQRNYELWIFSTIIPMILLVATSWGGFFIKITQLMPRVAVAFIGFLTLSNWIQGTHAKIPEVNYSTWCSVFMEFCRYSVFLSLLQVLGCHFVHWHYGQRTADALDTFSRVLQPLDFVFMMIIMFCTIGNSDAVQFMNWFTYVNLILIVLATVAYVLFWHRRLINHLQHNPFYIYGDGIQPMDCQEAAYIFKAIDKDAKGGIKIDDIAAWLKEKYPNASSRHSSEHLELFIGTLKQKLDKTFLTPEVFAQNMHLIFVEFRSWDHALRNDANQTSSARPVVAEAVGRVAI